jgi:DNA-binding MarR family transcriptional regulator
VAKRKSAPAGDEPPALQIRVDRAMETRWPGSDAQATELAINFFALNARVEAFGEALCARHGVPSPAAFNVLTILHGAGAGLPPSQIAARVFVSRPTMTGVLATLSKRRLVRLRAHPDDGRMQIVELTAHGKAVVEEMRPRVHAAEKRWMACLSPHEAAQLGRILARLQQNVPRIEDEEGVSGRRSGAD